MFGKVKRRSQSTRVLSDMFGKVKSTCVLRFTFGLVKRGRQDSLPFSSRIAVSFSHKRLTYSYITYWIIMASWPPDDDLVTFSSGIQRGNILKLLRRRHKNRTRMRMSMSLSCVIVRAYSDIKNMSMWVGPRLWSYGYIIECIFKK